MRLNRFLVALIVLVLSSPAQAQQPARVPRIAFLLGSSTGTDPRVEAFRQGLRELGYIEGKNIAIEWRYAEGNEDRLPALADELVRLKVNVIVTGGVNATEQSSERLLRYRS